MIGSERDAGMSPDESPDKINMRAGTRRVNNWPMYLVGTALGVFMLIMVLVVKDRADKQHQQAGSTKADGGDSDMFAKEVAGQNTAGIVPEGPSDDTPPANVVQVVHADLDLPPAPPANTLVNNQREKIEQAKFNQFLEAVHAKTFVQAQGYRSSGSAPGGPDPSTLSPSDINARIEAIKQRIASLRSTDPTAAFKEQLEMMKSSGLLPSGDGGGQGGTPALAGIGGGGNGGGEASSGNDINHFAGDGKGDRWSLNQMVTAPSTSFELRAGGVLPATLISGINSDLPGQIMAQVSQNVYDTATGRYLLVPQGSRLVGTYASNIVYGQSRVLVAWQRIVFPDGKALDLGAMPGADPEGYAGYHDKVNNHFFRIFGSALLMSGITAGVAYSQDRNQQASATGYAAPSASQELSQALGQQLGMATAQMIEKNLNISPTLEIRPGFRFNVIVTKDIALTKPYRSFDY